MRSTLKQQWVAGSLVAGHMIRLGFTFYMNGYVRVIEWTNKEVSWGNILIIWFWELKVGKYLQIAISVGKIIINHCFYLGGNVFRQPDILQQQNHNTFGVDCSSNCKRGLPKMDTPITRESLADE